MRRSVTFAILIFLPACAPTAQDHSREYIEDGLYQYKRGSFDSAKQSFQAAIKLRPDDADLIFNLARCHDRLGQTGEAEKLYRECLRLVPDHAEGRHGLTVLLYKTNRRAEAIAGVEEWIKRKPTLGAPYFEDAWIRQADGDLDSARARLQQGLDQEPRNLRGLNELGAIYEKLGYLDRALVLYERSLEADPSQLDVQTKARELKGRKVRRPRPD